MNYRKEDEFMFLTEKLNQLMDTMNSIQDRFKTRLRFMLNFMIFNEGESLIDHRLDIHNMDLSSRDVELFGKVMADKHRQLQYVEDKFIFGDKLSVICKNDEKIPTKLKVKIKKGILYRVTEVMVTKKGGFVYRIEGVNDDKKFTPLRANRFVIVRTASMS